MQTRSTISWQNVNSVDLHLQPLWEGLCKFASQSPENGESKKGVIKRPTFFKP